MALKSAKKKNWDVFFTWSFRSVKTNWWKKMPPDLQPTQDWCHRVWPHTSSQSCEHRDPCRCNSSGSIKVESGRISFQHWLDLHLFLFQNDPSLLFGAFGASPVFMPPSKPSKSEKKNKASKKKSSPPLANPKFRKPQTCEVVPRDTLSSAPILCIPWSAPVAFQLWDEYLQTWFRQFWNCRKFGTNTVVREPPV